MASVHPVQYHRRRVDRAMERRLAAVLAVDMVGYSRLIEADEEGIIARLKAHRIEVVDPRTGEHGGRIVKTTGDGLLIEFYSVVAAVRCALAIQRAIEKREAELPEDRRILYRIGINSGDIVIDGDDILGEGVNVAARLEGLAEPGGICISHKTYQEVIGKVDAAFESMGEQRLKNISDPVLTYNWAKHPGSARQRQSLPLPEKPSIAVLPFQNMSGDAEQEYFADGVVEEIITALSRFHELFVIARNSSFVYKGRTVDVKQVGRELGVRYVLEGSVRRAGNRVRITGQLIDTATGAHLWADRFDGNLEDIFSLQDQITESTVGAIAPKVERAEMERSRRKATESLDAYDHYLRGLAALHLWTREGTDQALAQFGRAIELDPNYAAAHGMAARCYVMRKTGHWMTDYEEEAARAVQLANRAVELGPDDAVALGTAGFAILDLALNAETADLFTERALALNPNSAPTLLFSGWVKLFLGDRETAIERVTRAMRLSPRDPQAFSMQTALGFAHFAAGRHSDALMWAQSGMRERPAIPITAYLAAASAALAGDMELAHEIAAQVLRLVPDFKISKLERLVGHLRPEDFRRWREGLGLAGLPE